MKQGLTRGVMVKSINPISFIYNKQWITKNSSFNQGWSIGTGILPYKRNEVRLTIEVPTNKMENCKPWSQMKFLCPLVAKDLEDSPLADPENWYIYQGEIKPQWIKQIDENEKGLG